MLVRAGRSPGSARPYSSLDAWCAGAVVHLAPGAPQNALEATVYRGLPPNPDAVRHDSHPDPVPAVDLVETDELLGPDLPDDQPWCDRTREWWDTWRRSSQAKVFLPTDWQYLLETASLHHDFWAEDTPSSARVKLASEIRMRVQAWGATYADRLKLRMRSPSLGDAATAGEGSTDVDGEKRVTSMINYRKRLAG